MSRHRHSNDVGAAGHFEILQTPAARLDIDALQSSASLDLQALERREARAQAGHRLRREAGDRPEVQSPDAGETGSGEGERMLKSQAEAKRRTVDRLGEVETELAVDSLSAGCVKRRRAIRLREEVELQSAKIGGGLR